MIVALRISKGERVRGTIQLARPLHRGSARAIADEWARALGEGWVVVMIDSDGLTERA